jgi:hypothetical protein
LTDETNQDPPILISTRFSLVNKNISSNGWQIGRGVSKDEYIRAVIADPRRLRPRAEIFFRHSLPTIARMHRRNPAIRHVVAASDGLPEWLLNRLDEAAATYSWLQVQKIGYEDDWNWRIGLTEALQSLGQELSRDVFLLASCRLDDDDVLAPEFAESVEAYIKPAYKGFCVSFTRGYCGLWDEDASEYRTFVHWKYPMNSVGLAYVGEYDVGKAAWNTPHLGPPGSHVKVDEEVPTILDGRRRMFIRSLHGSNDVNEVRRAARSRHHLLRGIFKMRPYGQDHRVLAKNEPADLREVQRAFPTLA